MGHLDKDFFLNFFRIVRPRIDLSSYKTLCRRNDLPECDSSVVRWNPLMPVGLEASPVQGVDCELGQKSALEASAGQHDPSN